MNNLFNKYHKKYDAWYENNRFAYLSEVEALKKVVPKKGKGLEVGVGTGRFASLLGIKDGVDPSTQMIKIGKKRGLNARFGFGEKLPYANGSFDYAAIIITICFVKDPKLVISEIRRVLKKEGRIIVGIVDKNSFLGRYYKSKKSVFYKNARFFSAAEIIKLLKKAGFKKFITYQTLSMLPQDIKLIEKPKKGFGRYGFVAIAGKK
ncbi:MAG: methyltransferase domain-containing protein [Candidatus Omnitrophica bacterium]|nr:methyltransferase domain-containing protein [Candidatus Omnitrophota bacterium]